MLGSVLLVAEIAVPGMFLLWWGLAVAVIAGVMKFCSGVNLYCDHSCFKITHYSASLIKCDKI